MNRYPVWLYLLILIFLLLSFIYSLPNFYGETPAVQISSSRLGVSGDLQKELLDFLSSKSLSFKSIELNDDTLNVSFNDVSTQLKARDQIAEFLGSQYSVALNLLSESPFWLRFLGAHPMFLGLDLRGGVHFLLEVDVDSAIERYFGSLSSSLRRELRDKRIIYSGFDRSDDQIQIILRDSSDFSELQSLLSSRYPNLDFTIRGQSVFLRLAPKEVMRIREDALNQNVTTLHNRVNELGVAEPVIQRSGSSRIVVELPGVQDISKAKDILGRTATLEVHLVNDDPVALREALAGRVPNGFELLMEDGRPILLSAEVELTGDSIDDAQAGFDNQGVGAAVLLRLNGVGSSIFARLTRENVGKRLAMVLVDQGVRQVVTAPVIRSEIVGGRVQISGSMTTAQARDVALLLRSGSLAAPVKIVEERTVGPSLGQKNIDRGVNSTFWGFVSVGVFMMIYYRYFGVISVLSLGINLLMLISILSLLQATLTLPGIAAIALTLGMAIDSNILINERVREEVRSGKTPQQAISDGYSMACATILDSNITTLIAALALLIFGSGPIRSFAVVHTLGILTSLFSAVLVSRSLVNLSHGYRHPTNLYI